MRRVSISQNPETQQGPDREYLLFLNDPVAFGRRLGVEDEELQELVRLRAEMEREAIRTQRVVSRRALDLYRAWQEIERRGYRDGSAEAVAGYRRDIEKLAKDLREESRMLRGFAHFLIEAPHQLELLAEALRDNRFPKGTTMGALRRLERRVLKILDRALPADRTILRNRTVICESCDRAFTRANGKSAQKYCGICRRRWSKQQLWYRVKQKSGPKTAKPAEVQHGREA